MATMAEDNDVDFEEGVLWLPAHVLEEACESKEQEILQRRQQQKQQRFKPLHTSPGPFPPHSFSKLSPKLHQRSRYPAHRTSGGPGMQAIFLDSSGQRSCGTGVFLPRMGGINSQQSKKPAFSPVLLPSRVVHALNLNVHALGSQPTPQRDLNSYINEETNKGRVQDSVFGNKNVSNHNDVIHGCVYSQACSSSPEIFLPKEWSY
ncbi:uncharacterized protein LOC122062636 [Macadamia integrifolia]|uniref:uncharacterized protein LOC122062636 n=1 Tax=Macadamia integrifolia TaxID=60698 RepID=UPI001C4F44BD|nr:uncharacterized protein LOC122062636 [Macadamia integrifolia]